MSFGHLTDRPGRHRLNLLCRLFLVAIIGGALAVAVLGSSFPTVVLAALLLACLVVCLVLMHQSKETEGSIRRSVAQGRCGGRGSSPDGEPV